MTNFDRRIIAQGQRYLARHGADATLAHYTADTLAHEFIRALAETAKNA